MAAPSSPNKGIKTTAKIIFITNALNIIFNNLDCWSDMFRTVPARPKKATTTEERLRIIRHLDAFTNSSPNIFRKKLGNPERIIMIGKLKSVK